ncbi:MAG TPA: hypothetical protein VF818_04490 [Ktedonobacterales bacterium]
MQSLPPALFLVMLELTAGAFLSLYLLDLRGDTSRGFVLFQGALYAVFALLTLGAMQSFASKDLLCQAGLCQADLDPTWLAWQGPLVVAFTLLLLPWNVLLWLSPRPPKKGSQSVMAEADGAEIEDSPADPAARAVRSSPRAGRVVLARHIAGGVTAAVGVLAVFVVGMAYRPLADAHLGGAFTVAAFLAGTVALGGVTTAMLLGHWYLNTPTASGKPLEFTTALLIGGVVAELIFVLLIGPGTAHPLPGAVPLAPGTTIHTGSTVVVSTPTPVQAGQPAAQQVPKVAPIDTSVMVGLQYSMGLFAPLILGAVAYWLTRGRSFQSATGMLYLCMAFVFIGEILARGLMLLPIL